MALFAFINAKALGVRLGSSPEYIKKGEGKLAFFLLLTVLIISYVVAYFIGRMFRHMVPKGKEFEVGSACSIGILIIFMTKNFWFPTDKNDLYFTIGFGLSMGLMSSITSFGRKRK